MKLWPLVLLAFSGVASAVPLDSWPTWNTNQPYIAKQVPPNALIARGTGTDAYYVLEVDPATGALPVSFSGIAGPFDIDIQGKSYVTSSYLDYLGTNVTTGAWVQIIASTPGAISAITLFDSCGETLELGTGAAAAETRVLLIPPGGVDSTTYLAIPAGTRLSLRAVSADCLSGTSVITGLN